MIFGLFSRKPAVTPAFVPPSSPITTTASDSISKPKSIVNQQQLRTPSPSIVSGFIGNPNNSPTLSTLRPTLMSSPDTLPSPPPPPLDPSTLYSFLLTIPPKILHEYTLAQLNPNPSSSPLLEQPLSPPSPLTLTVLSTFFASLTPPPLLHCARCHKGFFEIENDDRSCTVQHDDESAEVERVGRSTGRAGEYETLWGCCGKTVEGDGDMGPPDGWCYEGRHTTDTKRARFRADSTIHDDKLATCAKLHCHDPPPAPGSTRKTRKRSYKSLREEEEEEEEQEDEEKGERKEGRSGSEPEDTPASIKKRPRGRSASATVSVRSKKEKRKVKVTAIETGKDVDEREDDQEEPTSISMAKAPASRVKPKSSSTGTSSKPKSKPNTRSRSKAGSRNRPAPPTTPPKTPASVSAPARIVKPETPRTTRARILLANMLKQEEEEEEEEEKPRKKRRVA